MRLATVPLDHGPQLVLEHDHALWWPSQAGWPVSLMALLAAGRERQQEIVRDPKRWLAGARRLDADAVEWLAPIPRPAKNILCLGLNYRDHAEESARAKGLPVKLPKDAVVFTKAVTTVTGPYADVPAHATVTKELDWEVELGVIIGTGGRGIARERALDHVFGYTVINDLSARDLQFRHSQFFLGKSLDGHCPMGPVVVTADEIPDPQKLVLTCKVNGALKQDGHTRDMIFDVATTIEILSRGMTLEPGDIISTGTPAGVGFARQPPEFLRPGDVVECTVQNIGTLRNRVAG
jgi:2-keto-4-pentenoate hydratase/2-oxohepta-3-ene-1,7-dioic acid hydratase in catechol pathway